MTLAPGSKLGPYEILAPIGAGGMGEVYRARDTRLDRIVAIKTSKDPFDERFEREARAVAALNHPHICHLYDVGPNYLVMEYIEGSPLKGPLPLDQALKYGAQICDALDAAHRRGITHRDLKPANILVTKTAGVKLLDFGLAKIEKVTGPSDATKTMALTGEGQILGTLYYMSPEQLQGQEAGPTSDIFSFGLVLYEMLTGRRAFDGNSQASVIAAILERSAPSISNVAPPALDRVLKRCLEKDPENRWHSAKDLKAELEWIATGGGAEIQQTTKTRPPWVAWAIAAAAVIVALVLGFVHFRETPLAPLALRLPVALPFGVGFLALSPDGRMLVLAGLPSGGRSQLYLRALDSAELRPISDTVDGRSPFWSGDGRSIGFFAGGKLKIVSASGGQVQTLCDSGLGWGGTWNRDGVILFSNPLTRQILRVSASGGGCTPVLTPEGSTRYVFPVFLPDGRHFFYASDGGEDKSKAGVYVASLDNPARGRRVLTDPSSVIYAPADPGSRLAHLLFLRETRLMAQPFDPGTLQPVGEVFPVAAQASFSLTPGQVAADVAASGVLVYISNLRPEQQLVWFDRSGKEIGRAAGTPSPAVSLSPDGKSVFVARRDSAGRIDLWLRDLGRDVESRFTQSAQPSTSPVWSPDGVRIAFTMSRRDLYLRDVSGRSEEPLVQNSNPKTPSDWSPDGRFLLYTETDPKTQGDIWILSDPLNKSGGRKAVPFLRTRFNESQAQFSPDGHWIAYYSNESGTSNVYIRPFSSPASDSNVKWQVSSGNATQPRWSRDGKELFYLEGIVPRQRLMAFPIAPGPRPVAAGAIPKVLFEYRGATFVPELNGFAYSPSPDGQRFLMSAFADQNAEATLNVLVNWQALAKKGTTGP